MEIYPNGMFQRLLICLNSIFNVDISKWDVSKVTDMRYMFNNSDFDGDLSKREVITYIKIEIFLFNE